MASERVTAHIEERGSRGTARGFKRVARAADEIDDSTRKAAKGGGVMSRAMEFLGTRMGMLIIVGTTLAATLGPGLVAAVALLTPALLALGGVAMGAFVLAAGVAMVFKKEADKAGTAAYKLKNQWLGMAKAFQRMITPAANAVMVGLTRALERLEPVMAALRPAFTTFGKAAGRAIQITADALAGLGPQFGQFLVLVSGLLPLAARAIGPFTQAMMTLGMAGIPVLRQLIKWIIQFSQWLAPAVAAAVAWEKKTGTLRTILAITGGVIAAIAGVIFDLGRIVWGTIEAFIPFGEAVGPGLLGALSGIAGAIGWIADNMETIGPPLAAFVGTLGVLLGILKLVALAQAAWNAVMLLSPLAWIILGIAALAAAVVIAYNKWGWFHRAVNNVWVFLRDQLWPILKQVGEWIGVAFVAYWGALRAELDLVLGVLKTVYETAKKAWDMASKAATVGDVPTVANVGGANKGLLGLGVLDKVKGAIGTRAAGGPVKAGRDYRVGEAGPEVVRMGGDGTIIPNSGGEMWIAATFVTPDGQVLARQTVKAARKAQSVR